MDALSDIAQAIQLAVAPVFLLAGVGALMNVVTSRLGRVVDRARTLEAKLSADSDDAQIQRIKAELQVLDRRMVLSQRAISLISLAALLVCLVVALLFVAVIVDLRAAGFVAALFITAMAALIFGLSFFLAEISIATRTLRVRAELFMKD